MYIAITMNHVRAVKSWAEAHGGQANLNVLNFELEVKARNRYFTLFPQFLASLNGRLCHVPQLTREANGFIGWLPYRPIRWALSSDKLIFKKCLMEAGISTPALWESPSQATSDYIVKRSVGSFGYDMAGPFRLNSHTSSSAGESLEDNGRGSIYTEAFIEGRNVKVWFWGSQPFHAQLHPYPKITGDAQSTVKTLAAALLERAGLNWETYEDQAFILQTLAYQGISLDTVLPQGQEAWLDYRYGRRFAPDAMTEEEDNALPRFGMEQQAQITRAGQFLAHELSKELSAPVLYSVDGVLDKHGNIWWLEINSNPAFPPTGYPAMLSTLFGTPIQSLTQSPNAQEALS